MIYLDNAATSFPKPRCVIEEVLRCLTQYCGNPGRGAHPLSLLCAEKIYAVREAVSDFWGIGAPERVCFTGGATHALNAALKGLLRRDDHVLISELEHNAVLRPLLRLKEERGISFDRFAVLGKSEEEILCEMEKGIKQHTRAVVCTHASNVCSVSLPLEGIGRLCRRHGLKLIVDAAQSAGHLPIDMQKMGIDVLTAPAHKGLYGIQGAGILALAEGVELSTLLEGGSGSDSFAPTMPKEVPERYEAGTLPTPAILALGAGIRFLRERTAQEIAATEHALFFAARERLESLPDIEIYQRDHPGAVLLFNQRDRSPVALAKHLAEHGICVRAGFHCAPMAHIALGTPKEGAVRIGLGLFNTVQELDALYAALKT